LNFLNDKMREHGILGRKDQEFLSSLDKKLHHIQESTFTPNMEGKPFPIHLDSYADEKMTLKELENVLDICEKTDLIFYPINTSMGFSVGYRIAEVGILSKQINPLLTFKESQLPEKYNFEKLSKYFMKTKNLSQASSAGIEIKNSKSSYEY